MALIISTCLLEMAMTNFTSEIIGMVSMVMVDTVMTKSTSQVMWIPLDSSKCSVVPVMTI